mgnify:FL=1
MHAIFSLLFVASWILLAVGLWRPEKVAKLIKNPTRKKVLLVFGTLAVISSLLPTGSSPQPTVQQTVKPTPVAQASVSSTPAPVKTEQQVLEEKLADIAAHAQGATDASYRSMQVEKSDSDRPAGTKMITVKIDLKSFWSRDSLLKNSGAMSADVFKAVYAATSLNPYDVIVWYYGETTDQYGNKKSDVVLTYAIDKVTFSKINWANFNKYGLCDFLNQEGKRTGTFDTTCNVLANIK